MASEDKNSSGRHLVTIGVFIPGDCQVLDLAPVDIMGNMAHEYMAMLEGLAPKAIIDLAPDMKIHYIGSVKAGETIKLTAELPIVPTHHYNDPEVAPGKLDIVLVPGPDPFVPIDKVAAKWLKAQGETAGVDILSVCTGIFVCGEAGLLKGREACGPRGILDLIRSKGYGEKKLVGDKYRWTQDGNLWSSGGITNGNDMVAAYCRATPKHFPRPLVEIACELADVGDRGREYRKSQSAYMFTLVINTVRAWLMSWRRK